MAEEPREPSKGEGPAGSTARLLEILVCPRTKTSLIYDEARQELISRAARLAFRSATASRSCWRRRRASSTTRSCAPWAGAEGAADGSRVGPVSRAAPAELWHVEACISDAFEIPTCWAVELGLAQVGRLNGGAVNRCRIAEGSARARRATIAARLAPDLLRAALARRALCACALGSAGCTRVGRIAEGRHLHPRQQRAEPGLPSRSPTASGAGCRS